MAVPSRRRRNRTKTKRPPTARPRPVSRSRAKRRGTPRQLERTLRLLRSSVETTISRAEAVLSASDAIAAGAVNDHRDQLVRSLTADGILGALDRAMGDSSDGSSVHQFREVLVSWLRRELDIDPVYAPGEIMEVPRSALADMIVEDDGIKEDRSLLKVRVLQAGWASRGQQLVKPVVEILSTGAPPTAQM